MKRFLVPILLLSLAPSLFAQAEQEKARQEQESVSKRTRIAKQSATTTGDRGLFTIPSVETLNRNQFSFGAGLSNIDRTPLDLDINTFPVYFSYGLFGRLTVTGTFEAQRQIVARNLVQPGFNSSFPFVENRFTKGYGDTVIGVKYRLQRRRDNVGGIALKGFVKIPTADSDKALGTNAADVGVDLIFSSLLPWNFMLQSSMAFTATRDSKEPFVQRNKDEMRSGFGAAWPSTGLSLGATALQGVIEYSTITYVGAGSNNAARTQTQNASDIAGGVRYLMLDQGITIDAGYRINKNFDFEFPNNKERNGFTFNVTFTKPVEIPNLNNRYPVVALEADNAQITAGASASITATGFDADNDPLTYSWSATGGQIVGSGDKATFTATGLGPGTYTVRATATDGRGGVSISEIDITVRQ